MHSDSDSDLDFIELDGRARDFFLTTVAPIRTDQLALPTPCADWTLHGLLRHQVSQDEGFAAAARGDGADLRRWRGGSLGDDPYAACKASAELVAAAFAEDGVAEREFALPEVRAGGGFPGAMAVGFHFVDLVVHAWDVAVTVGAPWQPDAELTEAALAVAVRVPADPGSRGPGASFAPPAGDAATAEPADRLLRLLGRDPRWRP